MQRPIPGVAKSFWRVAAPCFGAAHGHERCVASSGMHALWQIALCSKATPVTAGNLRLMKNSRAYSDVTEA
jgi:hypothetical protein